MNCYLNKYFVVVATALILICLFGCKEEDGLVGPCGERMHWEVEKNSNPDAIEVAIDKREGWSDEITITVPPAGGCVEFVCTSHKDFFLPQENVGEVWEDVYEIKTANITLSKKSGKLVVDISAVNPAEIPEDCILYISQIEASTKFTIKWISRM